ncbi:MAG: beta-galactosidase [Spirochaetales bacterium]|nr:beta-galactosidase [Spirochaetales bacterium]
MREYNIRIPKKIKDIYKSTLRLGGKNPGKDIISFTNYYMELNNKPFFGICGEFHYSRYSCQYWNEELLKMKMAGINIISTYIFWIYHEEREGHFDWGENKNLRHFIDLCALNSLYVILRIGPFSHGECRNGGLPDWLYGRPFRVRSNDEDYLTCVGKFFREISKQTAGRLFKDGGPVIGIQLENEYMHAAAPWELTGKQGDEIIDKGDDGESHMRILKEMAIDAGFDVPLYTSTGWGGSPVLKDEILPLYGGYAFCPWNVNEQKPEQVPTKEFLFRNYHTDDEIPPEFNPPYRPTHYPYMGCEMGSGMQVWYQSRFIVPPESMTALTIRKVAGGCNFVGYYMFHGGSHPVGRCGFLNEHVVPKISYDFQAPLGEFGQVRESYKYLKLLFYFFSGFSGLLCSMSTILSKDSEKIEPSETDVLRYAARSDGTGGFLFFNNYQDHVRMQDHHDIAMTIDLGEEQIVFPKNKGMTILEDGNFILPFNLDMSGILLKYSTTQLITAIGKEQKTYFFFSPPGVDGEYCFDNKHIKNVTTKNCHAGRTDSGLYIVTEPEKDAVFELMSIDGKKMTICTLPFRRALGLYKTELCGKESVLISDSTVLAKGEILEIMSIGKPLINISIFPLPEKDLTVSHGIVSEEHDSLFVNYTITLKEKEIEYDVKYMGNQKATLRILPASFKELHDIFLYIDYEGDVGNAFIDGKLINDNFYNGTPWEIGLKQFFPRLIENEIYFYIIPWKKGKFVYYDSAMALKKEFKGEQGAAIHSIKVLPEYEVVLDFSK